MFDVRFLPNPFYIPELCRDAIFPVAFISADCNDLKKINDTSGHAAGDEALMAIADCYRDVLDGSQAAFKILCWCKQFEWRH